MRQALFLDFCDFLKYGKFMTCKCENSKFIPKDQAVDIISPKKGGGWIAVRFWKDCPIHGIKYLTPSNSSATDDVPTKQETEHEDDHPPPSNAEDNRR